MVITLHLPLQHGSVNYRGYEIFILQCFIATRMKQIYISWYASLLAAIYKFCFSKCITMLNFSISQKFK